MASIRYLVVATLDFAVQNRTYQTFLGFRHCDHASIVVGARNSFEARTMANVGMVHLEPTWITTARRIGKYRTAVARGYRWRR